MKIFFIATLLPPFIGSANIRALNYINYLSRLGNTIDVIGVDYPKDSIAYDNYLEDAFDKEVEVYRINPGFFYNMSYTKKTVNNLDKNTNTHKSSLKKKIASFVKRNILIPDPYVLWIYPAYKKALDLIKEKGEYDCIFSMHETPSSHVVAYKIKKKHPTIQWVGYWSDPWNNDILRENRSFFKIFIEEKMEKNMIKRIDKLLFTTNSTCQLYINKYKLNPNMTDIVFRGYDESLYQSIEQQEQRPEELKIDKFNMIHTGTIYKELRNINPLYNALKRLKKENYELFQKINIIFIGQFTDKQDEVLMNSLENVIIKPLIPYKESLKYVVYADALILFGNRNSTQIPGKAYEYIGSKGTVLTILGDQNDELKDLMEEIQKGPIILNREDYIYSTIISLYNNRVALPETWNTPAVNYKWINVVNDLRNKFVLNEKLTN